MKSLLVMLASVNYVWHCHAMRFAVLEYTSKSGNIWRHTKEKPNYLADPQTEIDPTSFGCYVSALAGEHIPLTKIASADKIWRRGLKRLTGFWPIYSLKYLQEFNILMVVHQLSDAHELVALLKRLKEMSPRPFIIGVPTQPYGLLRPATENNNDTRQSLISFINACDVFISVVENTVGWYKNIAQTPITYLPQPYPAAFASRYYLPRSKKDKTMLVAGVTQRDNIRQGQAVALALQKKFPEFRILVPNVAGMNYDTTNLAGANFQQLAFEPWRQHLETLARTTLVINTDYTKTRGRVQTDCAAVGTPSLGGNSDGAVDLFPQLTSDGNSDTEKLLALGERLLTDNGYYAATTTYATDRLKKYDYEESAARLILLTKKSQPMTRSSLNRN